VLGLLQYLTPTMVLLLGVFHFGENVTTARWVGIAFVWTALGMLAADAFRAKEPAHLQLKPGGAKLSQGAPRLISTIRESPPGQGLSDEEVTRAPTR
jgi:hypothetical protein